MKVYLVMAWNEPSTTWEYDCLFSTRQLADAYVARCIDEYNPAQNFMVLEEEMDKYIGMAKEVTEEEVKICIRIILADEKAFSKSLNYAINYAKVGLNQTGHDLAVQCLYILNSIAGWRNPAAKSIRNVLRQFAKEN